MLFLSQVEKEIPELAGLKDEHRKLAWNCYKYVEKEIPELAGLKGHSQIIVFKRPS